METNYYKFYKTILTIYTILIIKTAKSRESRIVNGQVVSAGSQKAPWIVGLMVCDKSQKDCSSCGGSAIADGVILTAIAIRGGGIHSIDKNRKVSKSQRTLNFGNFQNIT